MADSPEIQRLKQAEKNLEQARREHDKRVQGAKQDLARARKEQQRAIDEAQRNLDDEDKRWTSPVERFGAATLYRDHLSLGKTGLPLSEGMSSNLLSSGSILTGADADRAIALDPSLSAAPPKAKQGDGIQPRPRVSTNSSGQRVVDTRTLVIRFSGPTGSLNVPANPDKTPAATEFASHVLTAGNNVRANTADHEQRRAVLLRSLESAKSVAPEVEQAKQNLDYAQKAVGSIQNASLNLDQVRQATPPNILAEYDKRNRARSGAMTTFIIIVVLIVLSLAILWILRGMGLA